MSTHSSEVDKMYGKKKSVGDFFLGMEILEVETHIPCVRNNANAYLALCLSRMMFLKLTIPKKAKLINY